jgi:hypothetical protein
MNSISNIFRRLRRLIPTYTAGAIRLARIPMLLFGVCCYQFYHYQRIKTSTRSNNKNVSLEPFNYELYESIKDDEDIIILVDSRFNEDFDRKLKGILFDLSEGTLTNKRQLRILSVHFNDPAQLKEFEDRCKIKLSY